MSAEALADIVLVVHFAFVLFVVGSLVLILLGAWRGWQWVRNRTFRYVHLGAIVYVTVQTLLGYACPLTIWENTLRRAGPDAPGFLQRWVGGLLYYDLPMWVFTVAYTAFAVAVVVAFIRIPPRRGGARNGLSSAPKHPTRA